MRPVPRVIAATPAQTTWWMLVAVGKAGMRVIVGDLLPDSALQIPVSTWNICTKRVKVK